MAHLSGETLRGVQGSHEALEKLLSEADDEYQREVGKVLEMLEIMEDGDENPDRPVLVAILLMAGRLVLREAETS